MRKQIANPLRPFDGVSCGVLITNNHKWQQYYTSVRFTICGGVYYLLYVCEVLFSVTNPFSHYR